MRSPATGHAARSGAALLLATVSLPADARILKTRGGVGQADLLIGAGVEVEATPDGNEWGLPLLAEYAPTRYFKIGLEPTFFVIDEPGQTPIAGFGEIEETITYEFVAERRYRPSISLEQVAKLPTAAPADLGSGQPDVSFGLVVDKEYPRFDAELNVVYTFVGKPPDIDLHDTLELALASEVMLNWLLSVEVEVVASTGALSGQAGGGGVGGFRRDAEEGGSEAEATLGFAEELTPHFKLEEGFTVQVSGNWQLLAAWEYEFGHGQ